MNWVDRLCFLVMGVLFSLAAADFAGLDARVGPCVFISVGYVGILIKTWGEEA